MGNDSPPHLSPNLQIKMTKRKSRSKMGLLNTLQEPERDPDPGPEQQPHQGRPPGQLPQDDAPGVPLLAGTL